MVIIGQKAFPADQASRMAEAFAGLENLPDFITASGPYLRSVKGRGIQSQSIFQCSQEDLGKALKLLNSRFSKYMDVPGYTFSLDVWLETEDL